MHAIKWILLTSGHLWDRYIDHRNLQYFYNSRYPEEMAYGKVGKERDEDDLEGLQHLTFHQTKVERGILEGPVTDAPHLLPVKLRKHNIGTDEKPKLTSIGDYWDEQTTKQIFDLLRDYKDLFPSSFFELKGIKGDIGEIKIVLKPDAKLVKHKPYR